MKKVFFYTAGSDSYPANPDIRFGLHVCTYNMYYPYLKYNHYSVVLFLGVFFNNDQSPDNINWNVIRDHLAPEIEYQHPQVVFVPETDSFDTTKACKK